MDPQSNDLATSSIVDKEQWTQHKLSKPISDAKKKERKQCHLGHAIVVMSAVAKLKWSKNMKFSTSTYRESIT